jgi:hypothetical protein
MPPLENKKAPVETRAVPWEYFFPMVQKVPCALRQYFVSIVVVGIVSVEK